MMNKKRRFSEGWAKALAAVMVIGAIVAPVYSITASNSQPRDDNSNSIIWGGCYSKSECINKMNNGDGHGHSASNIMGVYNSFGITKSEFNSNDTVNVTVYKDGRVVINQNFGNFKNGDVIANNSWSVGRNFVGGSWKFGSVWARFERDVFMSNSIQGFANIQNGKMQWFILKSCGNAGKGSAVPMPKPKPTPRPTVRPTVTPVPTVTPKPQEGFQCVEVDTSRPTSDQNLIRFTIVPLVGDDIRINGYRFTFSDNSAPVNNAADQAWTDREVAGNLTVFGQVKTTAGTTPITNDCSATVSAQVSQPVTTPSPQQGQVLSAAAAPLPATGPETALGGVAGLSAIGMATRAYVKSRKSLVDSLRRKRK